MGALRKGFNKDPLAIGCGGTIGFVGPLAELFGGSPALLLGIEDPASNAHAPNESLHEGDFKKLMNALVRLFDNLGKLTSGNILRVMRDAEAGARSLQEQRGPSLATIKDLDGEPTGG